MTLIKNLSLLIFALLSAQVPGLKAIPDAFQSRGEAAAEDVSAAVAMLPSGVPEDRREVYARLLFTWSFFESSWLANPPGSNDKGSACGVLQIHTPELWLPGATCAKVRASRKLGYLVGLTVIRQLEKKCGSLGSAMTAFSTYGMCQVKILPLVSRRYQLAGLTAACEEKP